MLSTIEQDEEQLDQAGFEHEPADQEDASLRWEARVFVVTLLGLVPGIQFGCILALCFSTTCTAAYVVMAFGGLLGMISGGLLEADHLV